MSYLSALDSIQHVLLLSEKNDASYHASLKGKQIRQHLTASDAEQRGKWLRTLAKFSRSNVINDGFPHGIMGS